MGETSLAAHQIAFGIFIFIALVLDAVAIAAQVLVGRMLGAGDVEGAVAAGRRVIGWSLGVQSAGRRAAAAGRATCCRTRSPTIPP